jgi:hypothetical protein
MLRSSPEKGVAHGCAYSPKGGPLMDKREATKHFHALLTAQAAVDQTRDEFGGEPENRRPAADAISDYLDEASGALDKAFGAIAAEYSVDAAAELAKRSKQK